MKTSPLFSDLEARGLVKQITDPELPKYLSNQKATLYAGFDPTSDSLHVGSLVPILTLRRFQLAGHRPIAVVGGATGMIGDPSGKSAERNLLSEEILEKNLAGISKVIGRFLDTKGSNAAKVVDNASWFKGFDYISFLRDVGKHFTVNHMISKDSVRTRLEDREHGISYTEFSYMLLQAYDFKHLYDKEGCTLQIGGSEQWGNITAGCELIRRVRAAEGSEAAHVYGLTMPLITKADGTKFGKTESGTIWLTADKTSPYQFYQYFIRTPDTDAIMLLKFLTFVPVEEILALENEMKTQPEKRGAQTRLARELTKMTHGEAELQKAEHAAGALFGSNLKDLDSKTLLDVFADAPSTKKPKSVIQSGLSLVDLLAETGLCSSKGAAKKDIQAGGIYINNEREGDPQCTIQPAHLIGGRHLVLRKGKKNYHLVAFE